MTEVTTWGCEMATVIHVDKFAIAERIRRLNDLEARLNSCAPDELAAIDAERLAGLRNGWGPLVGMPCTYSIGSDSYSAVVTWVSPSAHQIRVKTEHDRTGELFTRRADGRYRAARSGAGYITFLRAETHLDPSF